uniref:Forkhead-associated domain-containing protein 1-like n=1 Tax=Phallusia mammillata TaxID=59560 RepID=A0A6F9DD15_9ASCI|nr:forkhead-associated domain-containing protein 1-like [Phallusia mammillata]
MEQLKKALNEKSEKEMVYQQQIHEKLQKIKNLEDTEKQLRTELSDLENQNKLQSLVLNDQLTSAKQEISQEIEQYKEEIQQHSITIVTLEKQTQTLASEKIFLENTVKKLKENLMAKETELQESSPTVAHTSPVHSADITAMEQTIALLKSQLLHANHQIHMQQDAIVGLQRDLSGAQARISDMTGELSESQKQELEHNRQTIKHQEIELNTLRQQLLKMTALVDSQKSQMQTTQKELIECKKNYMQVKGTIDCSMEDLKSQNNESQTDEMNHDTEMQLKEGKIATELSGIGAICRGERHENVIARQREALAELRGRIKALEQVRPPLPSQEQALQQVILLKKELAEIRAKQAMEEDQIARAQMKLEHESQDSQQLIRTANTRASIERTTREHLEEGVAQSEKSYMDIMNSIAGLLGIGALKGMRTMQHVPQDEIDKLSNDRRSDLEIISTRIRSMLQRLDRKEHLLQGYEKDLSKLREAESFASKKSSRLAMLTQELVDKSQEIDHLREALTRTREAVEVEKRLNKAIKQRRVSK